jgi:alkanesulfonate monooxygenase SsuD/methylene tetrahydromethanopterin reductase-like flavin-dependent oxidoreductase (luciferase family)
VALKLGLFVNPSADAYRDTLAMVAAAEHGGLDLIGIQDHPYQRRFLDTFALIGDLLARTERLSFFPDVANLPLRHPAMLAKQCASLDLMSGGRFELGLGAGALWDRVATMGGPRRSPGEGVEALEEAIRIIRAGLSGEESVDFDGRYYPLAGWEPGPAPAHRVGIWLGAYKPRMLRLTGRLADGWLPSLGRLTVEDLAAMQKIIDDGAREAGRNPSEVRRMLNITGSIGAEPTEAGGVTGSVDYWVDTLSGWATGVGFDTFILWPATPDEQQVEIWGSEVAPRVHAEVAARRT